MGRRRPAVVVAALVAALAVAGCAEPEVAAPATPAGHACEPEADQATARVVDVYVTMLGHLLRERARTRPADAPGAAPTATGEALYLVDHAVPELQETGIPEREKQTPAPASTSTAEFTPALRRCLDGTRFHGLPPIRLVDGHDDPAIRSETLHPKGWSSREELPRRYLDGLLVSLGGVPDRGQRLALAASSSDATYDLSGGLFVLERRAGAWRVTGQARSWVS